MEEEIIASNGESIIRQGYSTFRLELMSRDNMYARYRIHTRNKKNLKFSRQPIIGRVMDIKLNRNL